MNELQKSMENFLDPPKKAKTSCTTGIGKKEHRVLQKASEQYGIPMTKILNKLVRLAFEKGSTKCPAMEE